MIEALTHAELKGAEIGDGKFTFVGNGNKGIVKIISTMNNFVVYLCEVTCSEKKYIVLEVMYATDRKIMHFWKYKKLF